MEISGPDNFCGSALYSLPLAQGSSVTWSASGTISITGSTTGSSVTVTSNGSGSGTLTASVSTPCGNTIISKNISTSGPTITPLNYYYWDEYNSVEQVNPIQPFYGANNGVCISPSGTYFSFDFSIEGATNVSAQPIYYTNGGSWGTGSSGQGYYSFHSWFNDYEQRIVFRITATNPCGTSVFDVEFIADDCYGQSQYQYSVSPNPASDAVVVEAKSENNGGKLSENSPEKLKSFTVKLYNDKGMVLREAENNGQAKVILNTLGLTNGTYFLHITEGKKVIKKQIIIQH